MYLIDGHEDDDPMQLFYFPREGQAECRGQLYLLQVHRELWCQCN